MCSLEFTVPPCCAALRWLPMLQGAMQASVCAARACLPNQLSLCAQCFTPMCTWPLCFLLAGANMANAWLMRPGSSMIELQPYGFDAGSAHLQYPLFNMRVSGLQAGLAKMFAAY